jgi:hypothetical protein
MYGGGMSSWDTGLPIQQLGHERIGTLALALEVRAVAGCSRARLCRASMRAWSVAVIGW